jgi:hypothetical protein
MLLSRLLMILALAVLAYLVWITMTGPDKSTATTSAVTSKATAENMNNVNQIVPEPINHFQSPAPAPVEQFNNIKEPVQETIVYEQPQNVVPEHFINEAPAININYEAFEANVSGVADTVHGAAPFGAKTEVDEGKFATVKYSGLVDANPGDVIQIEGTDLLTAPLVDNMLYTNSIANTNRNASNDLRGDIPLQFNDTYTPFYSSVIYGAPLSQHNMTIGKL